MTPRQRERASIYKQIIKNCDENSDIVSGSESFRYYLHGFRCAVTGMLCIDSLAGCARESKTPKSDELYNFLLPFAEACANSLLEFAGESNYILLHQKATYALSHLKAPSQDIRSASFVTIAKIMDECVPSMNSYGINVSISDALNISIENYMGIAPSLSNIVPGIESYQESFRNILHTAHFLLKDRIDFLMDEMSEDHHRFYQAYRRIRTYGEINYLL
ncbi:MAG: hypothetical protein ABUL44_00010 [Flavobacterium sp.]